ALPGGVEEYLAKRVKQAPASAPKSKGGGDTRAAKKELSRVEREIGRLDKKEKELHAALAAAAADFEKAASLDEQLRGVHADKAALEDSWLELYEATEA
ncbi:MAG: ABC transporter ATP-binding protein, partial [Actinomycetota bacterium]|nr:ABC transporter ATP-binding protein [Actinomycetota bacterium]